MLLIKQNNTITVIREFDANLNLTWDAWAKSELLDQWWGPEPYKTKTKILEFREGGHWLFAIISLENTIWNRADYKKINPKISYSFRGSFCDEQGTRNTGFPSSQWNFRFTENGVCTTVNIAIQYNTPSDLEKIIQMDFKEGFSRALNQLDKLLQKLTNKKI